MIRNLTYILISLLIAAPSFAEDNYDAAANPVDYSNSEAGFAATGNVGASYDNQNDNSYGSQDNNSYNGNDNYIAPQPVDSGDLARVEYFAPMKSGEPVDSRWCEDQRQSCGPGNPTCENLAYQCNQAAQNQIATN